MRETRKRGRQCRISVMLLLGPGATLPQTPDSVVSMQSGGITVLRLCGLALQQKKRASLWAALQKEKKWAVLKGGRQRRVCFSVSSRTQITCKLGGANEALCVRHMLSLGHLSPVCSCQSHDQRSLQGKLSVAASHPCWLYNPPLSPTEIHRVWGCPGGGEEGPAGPGGLSGAAGETAGAQNEKLLWPEWVATHLVDRLVKRWSIFSAHLVPLFLTLPQLISCTRAINNTLFGRLEECREEDQGLMKRKALHWLRS